MVTAPSRPIPSTPASCTFPTFVRILGDGFLLPELSLSELQNYVNRRTKAGISPVTIRKEIASFRAAWNWGVPMNLTSGICPNRGLRYPKADEKPPFMTWVMNDNYNARPTTIRIPDQI